MTGGGIKGAVLAGRAAAAEDVTLLHIDYGQRSAPAELAAAEGLAETLPNVKLTAIEMPHLLRLQQESDGPAASTRDLSIPALRGLLPLLVASGTQCALRTGASRVVLGISRFADESHLGLPAGDGHGPRGREFVHAFNIMIEALLGRRGVVEVEAPLLDTRCEDVHALGIRYGLRFEKTWSCTAAVRRPCGECAACRQRADGFAANHQMDPLLTAVAV
jgi:7-cyano-7-deazaguanine synthase